MTADWFLTDPALILPRLPKPVTDERVGRRVRFPMDSVQARDMGVSPEAVGVVRSVSLDDSEWRANVDFGTAGFVFGARIVDVTAG